MLFSIHTKLCSLLMINISETSNKDREILVLENIICNILFWTFSIRTLWLLTIITPRQAYQMIALTGPLKAVYSLIFLIPS